MKRLLMIVIAALLLIPSAVFAGTADLAGEWIQIETIVDGTAFVMSGQEIVLEVNADGTAFLSGLTYAQTEEGAEAYSWVPAEGGLSLVREEEQIPFSAEGGCLTAEINGRTIVFARRSGQETPAEQQEIPEDQPRILTPEETMDIAFAECPVDRILASQRRVHMSLDGTGTVTFHTDFGDYYYRIDTCTGEILDREEPDLEEARQAEGFREPLDADEVHDIVSAACPIDLSVAQGIRVERDDSGIWTYLFGSAYGDFFYQIDGYSGKILDSMEPDVDAARAQEGFVEPLTPEDAMDAAFAACPISRALATNLKVSKKSDGNWSVTFSSEYGDFYYKVDGFSGEILDSTEPEIEKSEKPAAPSDQFGDAIKASFSSLKGYRGGAENIKVRMISRDGKQLVEVTFDWNGESYVKLYDVAEGKLVP
jgi:hypothetical protein